MKKTKLGVVGASLLALPFLLGGCGEGAGEGASPDEDRTRYTPETQRPAPGGELGRPQQTEGDGEAPPPPDN